MPITVLDCSNSGLTVARAIPCNDRRLQFKYFKTNCFVAIWSLITCVISDSHIYLRVIREMRVIKVILGLFGLLGFLMIIN
jgi:hypothetical protein